MVEQSSTKFRITITIAEKFEERYRIISSRKTSLLEFILDFCNEFLNSVNKVHYKRSILH